MTGRGVMTLAAGHPDYFEAVGRFLGTLWHWHPEMPVTLWSDHPVNVAGNVDVRVFEPSGELMLDRIALKRRTPYERTLYVDADFVVLGDIAPLFDLLDRFDLVVSHSGTRRHSPVSLPIPDAFPEHKGGVQAWRRCEATERLFDNWEHRMRQHIARYPDCTLVKSSYHRDQGAFREALWESDLRFYTAPTEWACGGVAFVAWDRVRLMQDAGVVDPKSVNMHTEQTRIFYPIQRQEKEVAYA